MLINKRDITPDSKCIVNNCTRVLLLWIFALFMSLTSDFAMAQQPPQALNAVAGNVNRINVQSPVATLEKQTAPFNPSPKTVTSLFDSSSGKTPYEVYLSLLTIMLGMFMAVLLCVMGWKKGLTDDFSQAFIVVMAVFSALFLVVAGYDEKQTAPVFGILGTVLGYVFGRGQKVTIAKEDVLNSQVPPTVGAVPREVHPTEVQNTTQPSRPL